MLKVENVSYVYQPGTPFESHALENISFEIPNGSLTAIIGSTGSGKSTLLTMFNALSKPTSGKIFIDGEDITAKDANLKKYAVRQAWCFNIRSISCLRKRSIRI